MPAKIPFFEASESLQQRWREGSSLTRVSAQLYVFALLITIGLLRRYLTSPSTTSKSHTYGSLHPFSTPGARDETLGEVDSIFIYPIKSCAGCSVSSAQLTSQGFDLDRRWMVLRRNKGGGWEKISLREEPRLTLIQPVIEEEANELRLRLTDVGIKDAERRGKKDLKESVTVLRPSEAQLQAWKQVPKVEMYGDYADGRVAALPEGRTAAKGPSEWISAFLGYEVILIHFDTTSSTARNAFPIFKPPSDSSSWSDADRNELHRKRGIEFQDEYPLLVASLSSLTQVCNQLSSALTASSGSDGLGGRAITGIDSGKWSDPAALSMARFRPNIILKGEFAPFSEDSWERIWILPSKQQGKKVGAMLQLVARCQRCLLTAVDPITAEKDPSVPLKLLNRSRMRVKKPAEIEGGNGRAGPCFGMYAIPLPLQPEDSEGSEKEQGETYGGLNKGDTIRVRWRPYELDDEPDRQKDNVQNAEVVLRR